jgi:hypothetical protein
VAEEDVMSQKQHGTSEKPVQKNLRWNCDYDLPIVFATLIDTMRNTPAIGVQQTSCSH